MVIYESSFPAAELTAGRALTRARIGYHTYTRNSGISAASITVSTELADAPKDAPLRANTWEQWQGSAVPATWEINFGSDLPMNYVAIGSHSCGTSGNTIAVDTENSSSPGTFTEFADDHTPTNDDAVMWLDAQRNMRKLRLTFSNGSAPRVGLIYVGLVLPMAKSVQGPFSPLNLSRETELTASISRGGHLLGQSFRSHGFSGEVTFRFLDDSWYRTNFEPFVKESRRYPYFFAWNPQDRPSDVVLAWNPNNDIVPSYMTGLPEFEVRWRMVGFDGE